MNINCPLCKNSNTDIRTEGTVGDFPNIKLICRCNRCYYRWDIKLGNNLDNIKEIFKLD